MRALVAKHSGYEWTPGDWGKRFVRKSKWSAIVDRANLTLGSNSIPIHHLRNVRFARGVLWARVSIELGDATTTSLVGLTNRNGKAFVELLTASCVLSAVDRLKNLLTIAERERERWNVLSRKRRWIADSDVSRFMSRCPANPRDSELRLFLESDFAKSGRRYFSREQNELLGYLMGEDVLFEFGPRNERFLSD